MSRSQTWTSAIDTLRHSLAGPVLEPGGTAYEEARRVFNAAIDKHPAVIAQCESPRDVAQAIRFGREQGLEVAVRGGGHSVAGHALTDSGIVLDLRRLNTVHVDPGSRSARVGGGAVMSDLDRATEPHGLVTTGGRVSTTGVGGLTLGGGAGWLDRTFGLACDNLLGVEIVTADGQLLQVDDTRHPDLFWALHGGGGNFGVVTSFVFRLYPLPSVTACFLTWEPAAGPDVIRAYRDFLGSAPDEVGGALLFHTAPEADWVPERLRGQLACTCLVTYAGGPAQAREAVQPMLDQHPAGQHVVDLPYAQLQCLLDDPPGHRNYWSAEYLVALPDAAVELFSYRARDLPVPSHSTQALVPLGGAVARPSVDYPVAWRHTPWHVLPFGMWTDPADDHRVRQWVHDLRHDLRPWSAGAVGLNFIGDEGPDRVAAGLGADNHARLARVKRVYDPDNVFHLNHNIVPT